MGLAEKYGRRPAVPVQHCIFLPNFAQWAFPPLRVMGLNKKAGSPFQATRLSLSLRPVAFRHRLTAGLAFARFATIFTIDKIISCDLIKIN
jgi:hypothetical protein